MNTSSWQRQLSENTFANSYFCDYFTNLKPRHDSNPTKSHCQTVDYFAKLQENSGEICCVVESQIFTVYSK